MSIGQTMKVNCSNLEKRVRGNLSALVGKVKWTIHGLIKKYLTIFFLNKRRMGLGEGCMWTWTFVCVHKLLLHAQIAQLLAISQGLFCAYHAYHIDDDRETWAAHLHQVLQETWAFMLNSLWCDSEGFWKWGNDHMQIKERFRHFKEGHTSIESYEHSGRPSMIDNVHSS